MRKFPHFPSSDRGNPLGGFCICNFPPITLLRPTRPLRFLFPSYDHFHINITLFICHLHFLLFSLFRKLFFNSDEAEFSPFLSSFLPSPSERERERTVSVLKFELLSFCVSYAYHLICFSCFIDERKYREAYKSVCTSSNDELTFNYNCNEIREGF